MINKKFNLKTVVIAVSFAVLVYLVLIMFSDLEKLASITVHPLIIISFLFLSFLNILFRGLRWHDYSQKLGAKTSFKTNLLINFSGYSLVVTPGKIGDVLKIYLLKKLSGKGMSKTASTILLERTIDTIALALLVLTGIFINTKIAITSIIILALAIAFLFVLRFDKFYKGVSRLPFIKRFAEQIGQLKDGSKSISDPKTIMKSLLFTIPAWFVQCLGFYLLLNGLGVQTTLTIAVFIFSASILLGAVSMLPGGLGATEGTMTFLMTSLLSMDVTTAVWATLVSRACSLWFVTLIGVVSLLITQRKISTS